MRTRIVYQGNITTKVFQRASSGAGWFAPEPTLADRIKAIALREWRAVRTLAKDAGRAVWEWL
jgi:hypothetical protein